MVPAIQSKGFLFSLNELAQDHSAVEAGLQFLCKAADYLKSEAFLEFEGMVCNNTLWI